MSPTARARAGVLGGAEGLGETGGGVDEDGEDDEEDHH